MEDFNMEKYKKSYQIRLQSIYSGGAKTSVESLGGDFSINNAFNPRKLGAK